jgi:hypothetical protein
MLKEEMIVIGLETRGFDVEVLLEARLQQSNPRGKWVTKV